LTINLRCAAAIIAIFVLDQSFIFPRYLSYIFNSINLSDCYLFQIIGIGIAKIEFYRGKFAAIRATPISLKGHLIDFDIAKDNAQLFKKEMALGLAIAALQPRKLIVFERVRYPI